MAEAIVARMQDGAEEAMSLPGWIYRDPDFLEVEREAIFRPSWQIVCHVNDIPDPGDYHTFRFLGENIAVVRDRDGQIRAFHNVCRHRAARLLDGDKGRCGSRIVCPYHAWSYGLDGALLGVPHRQTFPEFSMADYPLPPVEHEIFLGFIFIRLAPGPGASVARMMAPYLHELAPYRFEELTPLGRVTWRPRSVNWKNVGDNYSDSLHITVAHPGLTRLFGAGYGLEAKEWVDKMWGALVDTPSISRSERFYQTYLPDVGHLPPERKRLWTYFKLWPNIAFDIYPDQVDFMQWLPISPTETLVREIAYVLPDDRREMRAVRYANWRINRQVSLEDKALIERVQDGMTGSSYATGPLGLNEVSLRGFANRMRALIPESRLPQAPSPGWSRHREAAQPAVRS
ncbi:aromatic ring-hydroxylating dioxygenase subunit alpha [Nitrospirillum sp. BR 11163]|uniref:aromatic ring-hydroxylating oxygenase subunit alpha n=1 Tax=Nitrospirillum sp. BR 11163 TaxID=3104323 RepID=UPI002AFF5922|nr:aromatic ring-hydroxylating dioxygenase subunit alpha [Nitrospirillum sp. BR 11163]MEA1675891.1 aromatic ring-hydroxylating dioxygenase subunit alpha [Nitrospirillum sp. BR 11163]